MAIQEKQLGQLRLASGTATSIYSPGASTTTIIKQIIICNTSTSSAKYRIFLDDNGTTYDQTTALFYDVTLGSKETDIHNVFIPMNDSNGNIAVRTDSANALTFTVWGAEIT